MNNTFSNALGRDGWQVAQQRNEYSIFRARLHEGQVTYAIGYYKADEDAVTIGLSLPDEIREKLAVDLVSFLNCDDGENNAGAGEIDSRKVGEFAVAMTRKMEKKRKDGYEGWQTCNLDRILLSLFEHMQKGDMLDVANYAMMVWNNSDGAPVVNTKAVWETFVNNLVTSHPAYKQVIQLATEHRVSRETAEAERAEAITKMRASQTEREKTEKELRQRLDYAEREASTLRSDLSRCLGYLDRVNDLDRSTVGDSGALLGPRLGEGPGRPPYSPDMVDALYPRR